MKTIFITVLALGFPSVAVAQVATTKAGDSKAKTLSADWPPEWLEGAWKVESVEQTRNGEPTDRKFSFSDYLLFTSGHRFSLYEPNRLTSAPMIGHCQHGESLHCLFKMTNDRAAMQTRFTRHADHLEYCSYLIMPKDGRYRFKRRLTRITNQPEFVKLLRAAADNAIFSPDSKTAPGILKAWIQEHELPDA